MVQAPTAPRIPGTIKTDHQAKDTGFLRQRQTARASRSSAGTEAALQTLLILCLVTLSQAAMHHETPDTHLTIFEDLGSMVPDSAYIHVLVPVDMRNFSNLFSSASMLLVHHLNVFRLSKTYRNAMYYDKSFDRMSYLTLHPEASATMTNDAGISIAHQIHELQRQFRNITDMLPQHSETDAQRSRQKRVIPYLIGLAAAAIIGAIVGTYFGPYNQAQFNALPLLQDMDLLLHVDDQHHHLLGNLNKRVNTAFQVLKAKESDYQNFDNHISIWNSIIRHLEHRLTQFTDFVTQLQHRRLSLTWFSTEQLKNIHGSVLQQARKNNLTPLAYHLTDYFQLDVSYVRSEHFITAIIHVPATASDSYFKVYRYVPFPIPLSDSVVMKIHAREEIIAVGHDNKHRVLSQTQLDNCRKHYQKFICETPLITNTNFSTTCVGSLMDHDSVGIQTHCSLSTTPAQESVFQITNNQFAIYSPETFTGRGKCSNGTALSALISTISKVTVPPGCSFNLRNHILTVPFNVIATAEPWVQETKWDTLEVPRQLINNQFKRDNAIQLLLRSDDATAAQVNLELRNSSAMLSTSHAAVAHDIKAAHLAIGLHNWYLIGLAGFSGILFVVICLCMCRRYRQAATVLQPFLAALQVPTTMPVAQTVAPPTVAPQAQTKF